jgi:hypothetical protein
MRRLLILSSLLLWVPSAYSQSVRYQSQLIGSRGAPLANQNVAVCTQPANTTTTPCSPLATLATSTSTTSGGANPTTSDINGNFFFYAAPGRYTIQIYGPAIATPFVQADTELACPVTGSCTVTGALTLTPSAGNTISLLNAQANASAIVGTGATATVYTYTLPANTVGNLKGFRLTTGWTHSTGSASVTYNVTLNGVSLSGGTFAATTSGAYTSTWTVLNTASTAGTSQFTASNSAGIQGLNANVLAGLAWASPQVLTLTFNVAATDQVTPIQWVVELIQ